MNIMLITVIADTFIEILNKYVTNLRVRNFFY